MSNHIRCVMAVFAAILSAAPAAGQFGGVITSSSVAYYNQGDAPAGETDDTTPFCDFYAGNHLSAVGFNWWFYRVAGDPVQRPFGT